MENLSTKAILLDMTTDLSRVGTFTLQEKPKRVEQFANKLQQALEILAQRELPTEVSDLLEKISILIEKITNLQNTYPKEFVADDAFTYGTMLSHKAEKMNI